MEAEGTDQVDAYILDELDSLTNHDVDADLLDEARRQFAAFGFAKASFLVSDALKAAVARDVLDLVADAGIRRDLRFEATGNTPRRMRNVRRAEIAAGSTLIPAVYESVILQKLLSEIAGESVLSCPYEPEQYVVTRLEQTGDTHGWHWDDYAFALVWIIECPDPDDGGFVQCVPGTTWNKRNPAINQALLSGPTYSFALQPGDLYLMRTDTTLHRVYPITGGVRTIINMGFASQADLEREISHETMDSLWDIEAQKSADEARDR
jgi:hypothetical protein